MNRKVTQFLTQHEEVLDRFRYMVLLIMLFITIPLSAQEQPQQGYPNPAQLTKTKPDSAEAALALINNPDFQKQLHYLTTQLPEQVIDQQSMFYKTSLLSILNQHEKLLEVIAQDPNGISFTHFTLHSQILLQQKEASAKNFDRLLGSTFGAQLSMMDNERLVQTSFALGWSLPRALNYSLNVFKQYQDLEKLNTQQAISLIVNSHLYRVLEKVIPSSVAMLDQKIAQRFIVEPETLITTPDGVALAATIVRPKNAAHKLPAAMQFTIYADQQSHIKTAMHAAAHGYVGVVANSRGKRSSKNAIVPWEYEGEDATRAIDWISKQSWSNGEVVMYGGSYNGFTQWAAAKHMHPALKAMAPYTAASLITGLPYENNIALTGNYQWAFHVTNNKTMDHSVYGDWKKTNKMVAELYESGRAFKDIDKIDGKANPLFQKWLQHPGFDRYYQDMVPYQQEYAKINIPVLTVTGYFDGGQISAVDYLKRHYKYNKNADHTLLIGPYDHGTAQGRPHSHYSNYALDEVALKKDTEEVVFAWFDHLLYGKKKPELLKDKVNYQLMGSNQWKHKPSYEQMNQQAQTFYLTTKAADQEQRRPMQTQPETTSSFVSLTVDMADRTTEHNRTPWPTIQEALDPDNGLVYVTEAFEQPQELAGEITGHFFIAVNKKDVDIGYNFYEINKDGQVFYLNTYRSRASYAHDMSHRQLLTPGERTIIPIVNARMTAKLIEKGSRLAIVLNVNKNRDAQVNMGSGKDVSEETIEDAGEKLTIKWFNDSIIKLPLKPYLG